MIKRLLGDALEGIGTLLYPALCLGCGRPIRSDDVPPICVTCYASLEFTGYEKLPENELTDRFAGRVPLITAAALLHYATESAVQEMIHALKYYNRPGIGYQLGIMLGERLAGQALYADVDVLVPVPIHRKRLRKRGYNQALRIAEGMSAAMDVPINDRALVRTAFEVSQTRLSNEERMRNVADKFAAGPADVTHQHVLLVDDVITTGATLDFCAQALLQRNPQQRLSIAALAVAQ